MEIINYTENNYSNFQDYIFKFLSDITEETLIDKFYICPNNKFGEIIKQINPDESFTNSNGYLGVGKTIYNFKKNNNIVIIREGIIKYINFISRNLNNINEIKDLNDYFQHSYYALFHEIGHCIDNIKRKIISEKAPIINNDFKIKVILNYFYKYITCEYFAETFVRNKLSELFIKKLFLNLETDYNTMINNFKNFKIKYKNDIRNLKISILKEYYIFCTQFFKYLSLSNTNNLLNEYLLYSSNYFKFNENYIYDFDKELFNINLPEWLYNDLIFNLTKYGYTFNENEI